MVDSWWHRDKSSPELLPLNAMATESSPRLEKLGEGNDVKLTRGFSGWCSDGGRPAVEKQIGVGFFSRTRSLEPREMMRTTTSGCGEGGGGVQRLLWGHGGGMRGQGGRVAAVSECGFNGFRYKVEREGGEGESIGCCLMRGNRGAMDGASLPLPWSTGGRPMAMRGVAAPARPTVAREVEVGDEQGSGSNGPQVLVGWTIW
jgi:hypothetical protein